MTATVRVVRAELRKLLTTRLWWGLLVGLLVASVVGVLATASLAGRDLQGSGTAVPPLTDPATVRAVYGAGVQTAYLCSLALGVIAMAFGCGATPDSQTHDVSMLVSAYADQAYASYSAALLASEAFALAVDELIAEPSAARLEAARTVWLATRETSGGLAVLLSCPAAMTPWRARVHAWPIDERVIDYV